MTMPYVPRSVSDEPVALGHPPIAERLVVEIEIYFARNSLTTRLAVRSRF